MVCDPPRSQQPIINVLSWIKAGNRCGVNVLSVLEGLGVSVQVDQLNGLRMPPDTILAALETCSQQAIDDHFPLVLGEALAFDYAPAAEAYLATSPTPREALRLLDLATRYINPWLTARLEETSDEAWISTDMPPVRSMDVPMRYVIESSMSTIRRIGISLLGQGATLRALHFRHAAPAYQEHYLKHFGVEARFNQLRNAMFFDRSYLDRPLPGGSRELHEAAFKLLTLQLGENAPCTSVSALVERHLRRNPHLLQNGLSALAQHMELTPRSLQRRLAKEGVVFSDLLNKVRCDMATRWLNDPARDINSVSERLGYRDRRAFTSAFKKWTGVAPTQYRMQSRRGPRAERDPSTER